MFSEQILSGFHEGVKALRLGVGKHLFFGHTSLSPPSSRPRFASRGEDSPQHPARQSDTALWVVRVGMVSVSATLSHPCLVWHTHLGHTGKVCHPHGRG
jgi:hypothetical protein